MQRIGIISDTHGKYDPRIDKLFVGVSHIIHAGDIGFARPPIIDQLMAIAPVTAITGNVDWNTAFDQQFPMKATVTIAGVRIFVQHIGGKPREFFRHVPQPLPTVAICGHSHVPLIEEYNNVLFINPGSASQPRGQISPTVAFLDIHDDGSLEAEIIPLKMTEWIK